MNRKAQAEQANQVDVLKRLYELRLTLLDVEAPLKNLLVDKPKVSTSSGVLSWLTSTPAPSEYFHAQDLTPLVQTTRKLLFEYFETRFFNRFEFIFLVFYLINCFFSRYIDRGIIRTGAYAFEVQMLLHPHYKNLDKTLKKVMQKIHGNQVSFIVILLEYINLLCFRLKEFTPASKERLQTD